MNIYIKALLLAVIVVYIVDLSGVRDSFLGFLSRYRGRVVKSFKPFTCSQCLTWWSTLALVTFSGDFSLLTAAYCALLSLLSITLMQTMIFFKEGLLWILRKANGLWYD